METERFHHHHVIVLEHFYTFGGARGPGQPIKCLVEESRVGLVVPANKKYMLRRKEIRTVKIYE